MYILILVTTLLMLLAIIGSTRFDLFISAMGVNIAYENYMQEEERAYLNSLEKAKYDTRPKSSKTQKEPTPARSQAISKLNISPLIALAPKISDSYYKAVKITLIRLIEATYGNQKFFQGVNASDFVEQLILEAKKGVCGGEIKKIKDLASLSFENPDQREIFYLMIKGGGLGNSADSLPSLLDFLTLRSGEPPVRVFLAKRPLLMALYQDPRAVDQLMDYRQHPFDVHVLTPEALAATAEADEAEEGPAQLASEDAATLKVASEAFKGQSFNSQRYPDLPETFLDFAVSGSTPPK